MSCTLCNGELEHYWHDSGEVDSEHCTHEFRCEDCHTHFEIEYEAIEVTNIGKRGAED